MLGLVLHADSIQGLALRPARGNRAKRTVQRLLQLHTGMVSSRRVVVGEHELFLADRRRSLLKVHAEACAGCSPNCDSSMGLDGFLQCREAVHRKDEVGQVMQGEVRTSRYPRP